MAYSIFDPTGVMTTTQQDVVGNNPLPSYNNPNSPFLGGVSSGSMPNNLSGLSGPLGGMPKQPVTLPGYAIDSFGGPGATGATPQVSMSAMTGTGQTMSPTEINSQFRNLYNQGYSGGQLAAQAQKMGITPDQLAQATGIPLDVVNQAYGGAIKYQQNIGAPDRDLIAAPNSAITNPFGIQGQNPFSGTTDPYIRAAQQTTLGNLAGAQQAVTANRVNQVTPYANLQYEQTGTDANGNPIWTARQTLAPGLQQAVSGLQSRVAQTAGQEFNPQTPSVGINPGETYSDAIMRRLQPQLERQSAALDAQLANQGIMPGSEAYNRAKTQQAQQQNDLLTAAQVGGINVGLQANQQAYNQALQRYNLPLTQLGAFQQATTPGYINPAAQAAVSGPDYLGAYTTSQAAQIAAQNAAAARQAGLTSGLFGLGAAGLLGGGGLPGLVNAGRGLAGLFSSTPSYSGWESALPAGTVVSPWDVPSASDYAAQSLGGLF